MFQRATLTFKSADDFERFAEKIGETTELSKLQSGAVN